MTREWGVKEPGRGVEKCLHPGCDALFETTRYQRTFCPDHRGQYWNNQRQWLKLGRWPKPKKKRVRDQLPSFFAERLAADNKGTRSGAVQPSLKMAKLPNDADPVYARVEKDFEAAEQEVMHMLETNECVYGASITEHHSSGMNPYDRLDLAIERAKPNRSRMENEGVRPTAKTRRDDGAQNLDGTKQGKRGGSRTEAGRGDHRASREGTDPPGA